MKLHVDQRMTAALALAALGALAGCAGTGDRRAQAQTQTPRYHCEQGIELSARFVDDTVVLKGRGADEMLLRDAGGQGPQQTVFSNARLRAEFGLGPDGRQARLQYFEPPLRVACTRD